jgi:hypothetical protein
MVDVSIPQVLLAFWEVELAIIDLVGPCRATKQQIIIYFSPHPNFALFTNKCWESELSLIASYKKSCGCRSIHLPRTPTHSQSYNYCDCYHHERGT